jgi:hypothetical protein
VKLQRERDDWWDCELFVDGVRDSGFGRDFPSDEEEFISFLADLVSDEMALTLGGWPICPDHHSHPLVATTHKTRSAVWQCPTGRVIAKIGELPSSP